MAFLNEQPVYEPGIYQLEVTDPLQGGPDGVFNVPPTQLANRTAYLKSRLEVGHNEDGSHKVAALKEDLSEALTNTEFSPTANIAEGKLNLYFRGGARPSNLGPYTSTRQLAEDIGRLTTMNSMGDLLLNKVTLDGTRNLYKQFYPSSGVLYAGASNLAGHTPVASGDNGGGIFTINTAEAALSNKLQIAGAIQYLVDGFCVRVKAPTTVSLPEADLTHRKTQRVDLVYFRTHIENVTRSNTFYPQGDVSGNALDWTGLTEEEQRVAAVLLENNLFVGADYNIHQLQYEWVAVANATSLTDIGYTPSVSDSYLFENGVYQAIELLTIERRNKGAFHSQYNPLGTGAFYGSSLAHDQNQVEHSGPSYPIVGVDVAANAFSIAGDHVAYFTTGKRFSITGAGDNSRDYQVLSASIDNANTKIVVTWDITVDSGVTGIVHTGWPPAPFYDIQASSTTLQNFTIAGNRVAEFPVGYKIGVVGTSNAANNKEYTVTACALSGSNTAISVGEAILNTGNTGKLYSSEWFAINYCFSHVSVGLNGENSGSISSGVVAASEDSSKSEMLEAHDHIKSGDVTDKRVYLGAVAKEVDPNLTLNMPVFSGMPLAAYELDTLLLTIAAYNTALTYSISAVIAGTTTPFGIITRVGDTVTWSLPEVSADTTVRVSVSASDSEGHISPRNTYLITVRDLSIMGDEVVFIENSGDWDTLVNATGVSGFVATDNEASGTSNAFIQGAGERNWAKYQPTVQRKLYNWAIDGTSTVGTLVLGGNRELPMGHLYAVKYAGSDTVTLTDLGVSNVDWNPAELTNILTLGVSLTAIPEKIFSWDGTVGVAVGVEGESLVEKTALALVSASTTKSQVVVSSPIPNLWVTNGYNSKVEIVVEGIAKKVTILSVTGASGVYTLQIPEQNAVPSAAFKPSCFKECVDPTTLTYLLPEGVVEAVYPSSIVFGKGIRQLKFNVSASKVGVELPLIKADLWAEM